MTGELSNRRRVLLRPEVQFGISQNIGDDAAGAIPFDVLTMSLPEGTPELLANERQTGENESTPMLVGGGMAKQSLSFAVKAADLVAGDTVDMSTHTKDAISYVLESVTQSRATTVGATLDAAGHTAEEVTVAAAPWTKNDLVLFHEPNALSPERGEWARIADAGSPYSIDPDLSFIPSGATCIGYGAEIYRKPSSQQAGGWLTLLSIIDGVQWELVGCRPSSFKGTMNPRGVIVCTVDFVGILRTRPAYASIPAHAVTAEPELQGRLGSLAFGDTRYDVGGIEFDLGLKQKFIMSSTQGEQGYSNNVISEWKPTIKFSPLFATAWEDMIGSEATALLQLGRGNLSGGRLSSLSLFFERGQIISVGNEDDDTTMRNAVTVEAKTPEYPAALQTGGAERGHLFALARA